MSEPRLYINKNRIANPVEGFSIELDKDEKHYLFKVLRLKDDDEVVVLDGAGNIFRSRVKGDCIILGEKSDAKEPKLNLTLFQFLPKGDKFSEIIRMCTELGVKKFVLIYGERNSYGEVSLNKIKRWQRIAKEAAELAGRGVVPEILGPYKLFKVPDELFKGQIVVFWENSNQSIKDLFKSAISEDLSLFIGAEGGISLNEIEFLKSKGAYVLSLGERILRVQTASVSACSIMFYLSNDIK
ncbi:Ribosomal RNA small subunit methyltransferase E [Thermodesulfobium narugense DSM 14796]|uniref:Ribosomal RNA small subunit methyltransferase E n=1 Tax=Thermodesulfobium narugense DSM 14796 TaxID=747365 RepID=M1E6R3_9BACT|nr:16S rRNA (uracil(1498)-N(3))-methyltransferase [Thermodesulfobium narugense]AEE14931.1 Ribosomal RNA small subunit methyltransferase E [Thermodesulfobium narugense DSM 14796]